MEIIQKVLIKQVLTEKSKNKLYKRFKTEKMQLEQECQQLLFEKRKLQNKSVISKIEIKKRFESEIKKRKDKIDLIDFKIEQLDMLDIGSEIIEKEVEALVEVSVGSKWNEVTTEKAIVIEDDIVIRIDGL